MKIIFVRRRFSPTGGAERYLERLARAVADQGHPVALWCEDWPGDGPVSGQVEIRRLGTNDPDDFARAVRDQPRQPDELLFSLERVPGCDLYRAGDGVHAEWLRQRARYSPLLGPIRNMLRPKNRQLRRLERALFRPENTGWIIANSRRGKEEIVRLFGFPDDRIEVIYNGVSFETFSAGDRARGREAMGWRGDEIIVLLVGAGRERKGVGYAREGVARAGQINRAFRLVVVEAPPAVSMPDLYAAADLFLLPTLYDPFANVTLEALAAGLPVITTVHNGASEIITHGRDGFILGRADDIAVMADHISALADPAARAALRAPAQSLARSFDLAKNVGQTVDLCRRAFSERTAH